MKKPELIVLFFCNAATISVKAIRQGIEILRKKPEFDSAVTVSRYNMWSPLRARKQVEDGSLQPFVPFETFGDPKTLNCDRDSQGRRAICGHELLSSASTLFGSSGRRAVASEMDGSKNCPNLPRSRV